MMLFKYIINFGHGSEEYGIIQAEDENKANKIIKSFCSNYVISIEEVSFDDDGMFTIYTS